jgi:alkylhydroperoxidase family enzyme
LRRPPESGDCLPHNASSREPYEEKQMSLFPVYTIESAPEPSKPAMETVKQLMGAVPNVVGAIAGSPALIGGFIDLFKAMRSSSLSQAQIRGLQLTCAVTNACAWAVAFHTFLALKADLDPSDVEAIRKGALPREQKLAALSQLAHALITKRGHVADAEVEAFLATGFRREQVLEVIAAVALATITNYVGNVAQPPIEDAFQAYAWRP